MGDMQFSSSSINEVILLNSTVNGMGAQRYNRSDVIILTFMKAFEPSSCAALALGPQVGTPASSRTSARPATRGTSGPMTTRPMPFSLQNETTYACMAGRPFSPTGVQVIIPQIHTSIPCIHVLLPCICFHAIG